MAPVSAHRQSPGSTGKHMGMQCRAGSHLAVATQGASQLLPQSLGSDPR